MMKMTRDEMIEKIELTIAKAMGMYIMPGSTINEAAAAVLDLCGPKPLIWKRNGDHWACGREGLVIRKIASRFTLTRRNAFDQTFDTIKAAKAAAQAHADAAHWANTRMGDV